MESKTLAVAMPERMHRELAKFAALFIGKTAQERPDAGI